MKIVGLIMAGGESRRMGVNKAFVRLGDKPLLQHAIDIIKPQLDGLALNIRGDASDYQDFALPLLKDKINPPIGPLGGIYTGLSFAWQEQADYVCIIPCDTPFLPDNLVEKLMQSLMKEKASIAMASSFNRRHPVVSLWHRDLREPLWQAITQHQIRKIEAFTNPYNPAICPFLPVKINRNIRFIKL